MAAEQVSPERLAARRARAIMDAIGELLLQEWDPIGMKDVPEAQDEYDFYVEGVYRVLASGASPQVVAEYLWSLEKEQMGLGGPGPQALLPVAERLCALGVSASQK